ncbi:MAG: DUF4230 domain-containing protein [Acidimicrobiia bacterium]|nr:DUF4230 domain-containing protein [Acidimicrobiia bacterium]
MSRYMLAGISAVLVAILLLAVGIIAFRIGSNADRAGEVLEDVVGRGEFTEFAPVTLQTIRLVAELTTVEMVEYTTVVKGDDRGWLNWAAGDRIEMFAVARIGAGVDLDAIEEGDLLVEEGRVVLRLPAAKLTYVSVDNEATHVYNRDTGVFTKGNPDLERSARLAAEELLTAQAIEQGILEMAEQRAVSILTDLIISLGYTEVDVVVTP